VDNEPSVHFAQTYPQQVVLPKRLDTQVENSAPSTQAPSKPSDQPAR
jgi:moderate conductance mechanosensitive channel